MAFSDNATVFPVYGQEFHFMECIKSSATGNPLSAGTITLTVSKDGAAFAAKHADSSVSQIDTGGFIKVTLSSSDMTAKVIAYLITSDQANSVYATGEIKTIDTTEKTGHWRAQAVKKVEDMWSCFAQYIQNRVTQNNSSEDIKCYAYGSTSTVLWTSVVDNDGTSEIKAQAS